MSETNISLTGMKCRSLNGATNSSCIDSCPPTVLLLDYDYNKYYPKTVISVNNCLEMIIISNNITSPNLINLYYILIVVILYPR